jgi:hypothetical protein
MVESLRQAAGYPESPELLPEAKVLVIVDAGVATAANLKLLAKAHFHYLVNDTRRGRTKWRAQFAQEECFDVLPGREDKTEVKVRAVDLPGRGRLVLCKSQGRRDKELAIRSGAETRYLAGLEKLHARLQKGQLTDGDKVQRALGKLQARAMRVQRFYQVELKDPAHLQAGLVWQRKDDLRAQDEQLLGCYVLRTDRPELSAQQLWETYILLSRAEDGFVALKGDLGLRPNYHQLEGRVDAHIFLTVLAYQLLRFITYSLEQKGVHRDWPILRRVLQTHCYTTVSLPTTSRQRKMRRVKVQPPTPLPELGIHSSSSSVSSCIAFASFATQYQAFKQPTASPTTNSARVHGCLPGWCLSSQMPSAAPSSVGTTTDQPTRPIMPRPNQTPWLDLRALILRVAFAPISSAKVGSFRVIFFGSSLMLQGREATQKSGFQFCHSDSHALLVLVQRQEFLFHRRV